MRFGTGSPDCNQPISVFRLIAALARVWERRHVGVVQYPCSPSLDQLWNVRHDGLKFAPIGRENLTKWELFESIQPPVS